VLKLLPQGALDGLSGITLRLGDLEQSAEVESEPDPLTGRRGEEILPGVFVNGHYVGRYHARSAEIQIFAYVYDEGIPNRVMWELYLRLQMLATLVHELGHQHDFTRRTTRGRWLHDDSTKIEIHAERYEHDWVQEYVVPYLERAYPTDEQALRAWMDHHGGVSAPLSELAGDRRGTSKRGGILTQSLFGSQDALEELAKEVALGKPLTETRLRFAEMLRYMDRFDATLSIVERILSEEPDHLGTLTCQAITFERQGRHSEAGQVAERVLAADPDITDAWEVLVFACEAQHDWEGLLLATTRVLVAD
jgi:tetratricopeptide (TPR) repeat protein